MAGAKPGGSRRRFLLLMLLGVALDALLIYPIFSPSSMIIPMPAPVCLGNCPTGSIIHLPQWLNTTLTILAAASFGAFFINLWYTIVKQIDG